MKKYIDMAKGKQKVTQNGLAKLMGITGGALSQIANGSPASDDTIVKLARLSGVQPEEILFEYKMSKPMTPEVKSMWKRIAGQATLSMMIAFPILAMTVEQYILCSIIQMSRNSRQRQCVCALT